MVFNVMKRLAWVEYGINGIPAELEVFTGGALKRFDASPL